jgi:hypothetical protein
MYNIFFAMTYLKRTIQFWFAIQSRRSVAAGIRFQQSLAASNRTARSFRSSSPTETTLNSISSSSSDKISNMNEEATPPSSLLRAFEEVPRSAIFEGGIYETIGKTPIVRLKKMLSKEDTAEGVEIYCKLESENPGGSVKDRLALGVIEWAEKHGELKPGQTGA